MLLQLMTLTLRVNTIAQPCFQDTNDDGTAHAATRWQEYKLQKPLKMDF